VNRVPKSFIASALAIFFALAVWCANLATPAHAFASQMSDCSQPDSASEHPCQPVLCDLAGSHNLLSQGALVSTRSYDSARDGLFLLGAILPALSHNDISLVAKQFPTIWSDYRPEKVPVHLFNSVLTL
jgi:hypothetical protein